MDGGQETHSSSTSAVSFDHAEAAADDIDLDLSSPRDNDIHIDLSSPRDNDIHIDLSSPRDNDIHIDLSSPRDTDIDLDLSSPRDNDDENNGFSLLSALPVSTGVPKIIISDSTIPDGEADTAQHDDVEIELEINDHDIDRDANSVIEASDIVPSDICTQHSGDLEQDISSGIDGGGDYDSNIAVDAAPERSNGAPYTAEDGEHKISNGAPYTVEGVHCPPPAEFSDVVVSSAEKTTDSEFASLKELSSETEVKDELELEADAINLDTILMKERQQESDSDSEFDFDLPSAPPSKAPTAQAPTAKAPTASQPSSQLGSQPGVQPGSQQQQAVPHVDKVIKQEEPRAVVLPRSEPVVAGPDVTDAAVPPQSKPLAFVKPTPQALGFSYTGQVEERVVGEGEQKGMRAARDEWDKVTTIQPGYKDDSTRGGSEPAVVKTMAAISPYELSETLMQANFSSVRATIRPAVERRGFAAFINLLFGPPKLSRNLIDERDKVFCIAASQLDNENSSHLRTLQTVYRCLTGSKFDCPRVGSHWEEIGFQGSDPATDLRGAGMLGLLNLLYFLKDPKKQALASDIYRLSLHPTQNFPFCVMGINMTKLTLQSLREEVLNKECNRRGDILSVVNEFYVALYLQLYQVWKGQGKTISDSGYVIKDIEMKAKKNPRAVLKNLEDYLNRKTTIVMEKTTELGGDDFVNVCD